MEDKQKKWHHISNGNNCSLWAKALKSGKIVKTNVEIRYEGNSSRPSEFIVEYEIDGDKFRKTILNIGGKNG